VTKNWETFLKTHLVTLPAEYMPEKKQNKLVFGAEQKLKAFCTFLF
jgi:hypothetical protein